MIGVLDYILLSKPRKLFNNIIIRLDFYVRVIRILN